jgi:cytochrome c-type biogenesis protein CcmH
MSAPLSRLLSSARGIVQDLRGTSGISLVVAAVFLLVAGIGAATSYLAAPPEASATEDADGDMLARLDDYARSIGTEKPAPSATSGELLPDVNTMIERLAARLETTPEDVDGWRMLGWSYLNMERYEDAAAAYAKAVALDPSSAEIKRSYEAAKAKAADGTNSDSPVEGGAAGKSGGGPGIEKTSGSEATLPAERDAAIRSMVDGLADRLEKSPRDVEGWTRLMRSRVVLGEREVAATALRKALEVFKDDSAASSTITAAAIELGLKAE